MSKYSDQVARFADRLSRLRNARGMSQQQLAEVCGMERPAISKIENRTRKVTLAEALALADALQVDLTDALADKPLTLSVSVPID